jgi:hypothetical protein
MQPDERVIMGENGRNYYFQELSFHKGISRFEHIFEQVRAKN